MPDETAALQEIASLLRRRVEQQDEMAKRSEERIEKLQVQQSLAKSPTQVQEESERHLEEMTAKMDAKTEQVRQEKEKFQQEQRQFQERLLAELERHNTLLEGLLRQLNRDKPETMS